MFVASFLKKQGLFKIGIDFTLRSAKKVTPAGSKSLASNRKKRRPIFCNFLTWQDVDQMFCKASAIGKKDFT